MDRITEQCEGVVGISDDVTVYGETEEQNDQRLARFMQVTRKEGLMLNSSKMQGYQHQLLWSNVHI